MLYIQSFPDGERPEDAKKPHRVSYNKYITKSYVAKYFHANFF